MKYVWILAALSAVVSLNWFCHMPKFTTSNLPERQLRFGSGGGFVGKEKVYILLENGQIFCQEALQKDTTEAAKVRAKRAKALFAQADSLHLSERTFQHPGNVYQFLEMGTGAQKHRITWGHKDHPVDDAVRNLYEALLTLVVPKDKEK